MGSIPMQTTTVTMSNWDENSLTTMTKPLHHKAMLQEEGLWPAYGATRKNKQRNRRSRKNKGALDQVEVKLTSSLPTWVTYTHKESNLCLSIILHFCTVWQDSDHGRGDRKSVIKRGKWLRGKSVFWTQQGDCMHELRMVMTACIRSAQAQARPNPSVERELGTDATPSHGAMDSYQPFRGGRVSVF